MGAASGIRAGRAFVEVGANTKALFGELGKVEARLKAFGDSIKSIGRQFVQLGVGVGIPLAGAGKITADFESQMARVKALTGATSDQFQDLTARAKQLGRDTVFMASDAAKAMGIFAQSGFKVNDIMKAVGPTLDLAAAGQLDVAQAADIAVKIIAGMGVEVQDFSRVVDVMTKAMTTANTDMTMLGEAFKFVGPIAKTAGISIEEITAAIQLLSNAGIQGEMAGTTLRGMILSLASPTKEAKTLMDDLGIQTIDSAGRFRSLTDILGQFERAIGKLGNGQKLDILGQIFPARQAGGVAELLSQGSGKLESGMKSLANSAGTSARIAAIQLDTLQGTIKLVESSIEAFGIELATALVPTLRSWGDVIVNVTNKLAELASTNAEFLADAFKAVVKVTALGAAAVVTGVAIGKLASLFGLAVTVMGAILSPMGLVIAGIVGIGAAVLDLGRLWGDLSSITTQAFSAMGQALAQGDLAKAGQILWGTLKVQWLTGVTELSRIWFEWGTAVRQVFADLSTGLASIMIDTWATIKQVWATAMNGLLGSWGAMVGTMVKAIAPLADVILQVFGIDVKKAVDNINWIAGGIGTAELEKQQAAQRAQIEQDRQTAQGQLRIQSGADAAARQAAAQEGLAASRAELEKAQADLEAIMGATGPGAKPGTTGYVAPTAGKPGIASIDPGQVQAQVQAVARSTEVKGTFNASGIRGLNQGDSVIDAVKDQTKETQKQTDEIIKMRRSVEESGRLE